MHELNGCREVDVHWFRTGEQEPRPYAELISYYDPKAGDAYAEQAVDELFTASEAQAVKNCIDRAHGNEGSTTITKARLPLPCNVLGLGAMPIGGGVGCYALVKERGYALPFTVWGHFRLNGRQLVDGSGLYRHPLIHVPGHRHGE